MKATMAMINIKYISKIGIAGILLATSFVSCTDEWDDAYNLKSNASDYITFAADDSSITASVTTRSSSGHLETYVEEWPLTALETATTRVAPTSSLDGMTAGLIGYTYAASLTDLSNLGSPWENMDDATYNFITQKYALTTAAPVMWNTIPVASDSLRVYGYTPKSFVDDTNATLQKTSGIPTITYTVPNDGGTADYAEQQDLLSAVNSVHKNYKDSIPLTFKHALTGIQFKLGFATKVKSISISGVYKKGTYKLGDFSNSAWTPVTTETHANDIDTYTISFNNGEGTEFAAGDMITGEGSSPLGAGSTLMLIPQTLPDGATVSLVYNDGTDHTISASIKDNTWLPNKLITYTLNKDESSNYIYFDLAAGSVTITASTYSGSIYKTEASTTSKITVSGSHSSSNKYYVYQSSTITGSPGYYTGTGYVNGTGGASTMDGKSTAHPISIPNYDRVTGPDGRSWSEYITNNPNVGGRLTSDTQTPDGIIEIWPERARAVGRERTKPGSSYIYENFIHISGTIGVCDLTLDNIYCNYHDKDLVNTSGDSYDEGSITYNATGTNNKLIITLVGDNRIGHLQYSNPNSTCSSGEKANRTETNDRNNFLIFEGSGSLTAADADNCLERTTTSDYFHYKKGKMNNYHGSAIGSNSNSSIEDVYGIVINSGVIYAGTTLGDNATGIGGGGNGVGQITINGGIVTCVASTTGSALGGGVAFTSYPGIGYVTINGGTLYAYNLDNQRNIPSSAIGGGGSSIYQGGKGKVTINDGYVYAVSSIGTAIGGGSSGQKYGGEAIIDIKGGTVYAKSISGTYVDTGGTQRYDNISGGCGIGGGTGYAEGGYTRGTDSGTGYNGGNATVTISGSPVILTGSVGGGPTRDTYSTAKAGFATVNISGTPQIQAQFVLDAGTAGTPSFTMTGGRIYDSKTDDSEYVHIKEYGGAVYMGDGTFNMSGGTIENCAAPTGGAVYIASAGGSPSFLMSGDAKIKRCSATTGEGGALYMSTGSVSINGSSVEIANCSSALNGGGIYMASGTMNMINGTIQKNSSSQNGGGISLNGGTVTMSGGTISGNASELKGGGVYINNGTFTMSDGSITGNAAKQEGGGVAVSSANNLTIGITGGSITANTSQEKGGGISVQPTSTNTVTMNIGDDVSESLVNPAISGNGAAKAGAGIYISGSTSTINIKNGKVKDNSVSAIVDNDDVENENGKVNLTGGDVNDVMVIYHRNDGSTPDKTSMQRVLKNANSNLICPSFIHPASKTFKEWNGNADGSGTPYTDGQLVKINTTLHIYAQWYP